MHGSSTARCGSPTTRTKCPGRCRPLAKLVGGVSHRLMSPYKGLDSNDRLQSWNHQLKVDKVSDKRIKQFADFLTENDKYFPEVGASCENPAFVAQPLVAGESSAPVGPTDVPTTPSPSGSSGTSGG